MKPPLAVIVAVLALAAGTVVCAQFGFDPDKVIPGGGIHVQGWTGKIDASSARQGRKLEDAKFSQEGNALHVTSGPATTFWNPANRAVGDYTIKGTFLEPKFMDLNSHPHSYGIVIGGNDMGTDKMSLVYCAAYGDGTAFVRGFGPAVFNMLGARPFPSVGKAAGIGQPVKQEIAWIVKSGKAECSINGAVIASYTSDQLVTAGKLTSLDGVFGIRLTHNVDTIITGFGKN